MLTASTQKYRPGIGQGELKLKSTTEMGCRFYNCLISYIQLFLVEFNNNFPGVNSQLLFFCFFFAEKKETFRTPGRRCRVLPWTSQAEKTGHIYIYIYVTILCNNGASIRGKSFCNWSLLSQPKKTRPRNDPSKNKNKKPTRRKKTVKS